MTKYNIAIIGARSSVGGQILNMLVERNFPYNNVYALASVNTTGAKVSFGEDKTITVEDVRSFDFHETNIVFVCPGAGISRTIVEKATSHGAVVIDSSGLYKLENDIPSIVPEVNFYKIENKIISNPHSCTIPIVAALSPLHNASKIKHVTISTYQAVSDLGKEGMDELYNQTKNKYMQNDAVPKAFQKQIAFNIIPQIGELESNGSSSEEDQITSEIHKILGSEIKVSITCMRVPVFIGHTISINVTFYNKIDAKEAYELLEEEDGLSVIHESNILSPIDVAGDDLIYVSRLRNDTTIPNSISLIVATDNLRKGSALNAVQIAEEFIR